MRLYCLLLAILMTPASFAQAFDRSLLQGLWAESTKNQYACRPDNLHHRFVLSEDGKTLTFKLDRMWRIASGREVQEYSATVAHTEARMMVIRYKSEEPALTREMSEWEFLFIGPDTYRWRSTSWPEGQYNNVIGVRCGP